MAEADAQHTKNNLFNTNCNHKGALVFCNSGFFLNSVFLNRLHLLLRNMSMQRTITYCFVRDYSLLYFSSHVMPEPHEFSKACLWDPDRGRRGRCCKDPIHHFCQALHLPSSPGWGHPTGWHGQVPQQPAGKSVSVNPVSEIRKCPFTGNRCGENRKSIESSGDSNNQKTILSLTKSCRIWSQ